METITIEKIFPAFERALQEEMLEHSDTRIFKAGEQLMKKGQYFKSSMLILEGLVKVYREDDEGNEFFMYYLQPGQACALSMICASRQKTSEVMAKAVKDTEVITIQLQHVEEWMTKYKSWNHFVLDTY